MAGPQRRTRVMNDKEKLITAYHEGGHALAAASMRHTDPVTKVTILPRGRALGYTMVLPIEDKYSITRNELLDQLAYAMGGRVAEEIVFHDPTTGASNDIEKATATARKMVTEFGMSASVGAVKLGQSGGEVFLGRDMGHQRDYSEELAEKVDIEVRAAHRAGARRGLAGAEREPRHPRQARRRADREGDARPQPARRDLRGRQEAPRAPAVALERQAPDQRPAADQVPDRRRRSTRAPSTAASTRADSAGEPAAARSPRTNPGIATA